jgi:hypothetical protein
MTRSERQRTTRRALYIGLAISAVAHAAALAWVAMPVRVQVPAVTITMLPPAAERAPVPELVTPVPQSAASAAAAAAASIAAPASGGAAPRPAAATGAPVTNPVPAAQPAVALADSIVVVEVEQAVVVPAPVAVAVAQPAPAAAPAAAAPARPVYVPGSIGGAKDRWGGTEVGADPQGGRGGIMVGTGRGGVKRHPPVVGPGAGRGGIKRHPPVRTGGRGGIGW